MNMIGSLPKSLEVAGTSYKIRSDYRVMLIVFDAISNPNLSDISKKHIILDAVYIDEIPTQFAVEALQKAIWFMNGGKEEEQLTRQKKLMDWKQDEQIIFSAVNSVAGKEVRSSEYLHWWTFLGYFNEVKEGLFSTIITIRKKKSDGKKLEKYEQEFYRKNKSLVDLKKIYSTEQQSEMDELNKLLD